MAGAYVTDPAAWRQRGYGIATPEDLQYSGLLQQHPEWFDVMKGTPAWDNSPLNPNLTTVQVTQPTSLRVTPTSPTAPGVRTQTATRGAAAVVNPVVGSVIGSPFMSKAVGDLNATYTATAPAKKQTLTDFTRELLSTKPQDKAGNTADNEFLASIFSKGGAGSLESQLNQLAEANANAGNVAALQAAKGATRAYNLNRMLAGNNSYLDRSYSDILANIAAQNAQRRGDQRLANLQYLVGLRNQNLGRRNALNQAYLDTVLNPVNQYNNLIRSEADTIGSLGSLQNYYEPVGAYPNLRWAMQ